MESTALKSEPVVLKRQLGLWSCVALTVGPIIGSGIFISPKGILQNANGSVGWALVIWVACGVFAALGALSMAELSTMFRKSGGTFIYILTAYNKFIAFLQLWCFVMIVRPSSNAIVSITMAQYLLVPFFPNCSDGPPDSAVRLLACIAMTAIVVLNVYSVPWSYRIEIFLDIVKLAGLLVIGVLGIARLAQGHTENFDGAFADSIDPTKLPIAFYSGMWAYSGWQLMPAIVEEVNNPPRNIPLAIIISMLVVTAVYIFSNVAYFSVLSSEQLLASEAVASDFALPILGKWAWVVQILVGVSCLGNRVGTTFSSARIMFIGSREGVFPELFSMISIRRLTPLPSIMSQHVLTLIMLTSSDIYSLINYLSFSNWLFIAIATTVIPFYRWKHPDFPRPYKVPLICPVVFTLCAVFMVGLSLYSAPVDCGIGLAMVVTGIPVYLIGVKWEDKPECVANAITKTTHFFQKLFVVIHQEEKTF